MVQDKQAIGRVMQGFRDGKLDHKDAVTQLASLVDVPAELLVLETDGKTVDLGIPVTAEPPRFCTKCEKRPPVDREGAKICAVCFMKPIDSICGVCGDQIVDGECQHCGAGPNETLLPSVKYSAEPAAPLTSFAPWVFPSFPLPLISRRTVSDPSPNV